MKIGEAPEPDQILWGNQQVAFRTRRYRACFLIVQVIFFVACAVALNYFAILMQRQYEKSGNISELMLCSNLENWGSLDEFKAQSIAQYAELEKKKKKEGEDEFKDLGQVACFCKYLRDNTDQDLEKVKFDSYDDRLLCKEWNDQQTEYFWYRLVYPILIVFIFNGLFSYLLSKGAISLKVKTVGGHSKVEFVAVFIYECISIGLAFMITTAIQ